LQTKLFFAIVHGVMSQKKDRKFLGRPKNFGPCLIVLKVTQRRATEYRNFNIVGFVAVTCKSNYYITFGHVQNTFLYKIVTNY